MYQFHYYVSDTPFHLPFTLAEAGFLATDYVIYHHCPSFSKWLLVTNADNEYHPLLFAHLDDNYDIIGFDFFSRYAKYFQKHPQNEVIDGSACDSFTNWCTVNTFGQFNNDLGAQIFNFAKFTSERRNFSKFTPNAFHDTLLVEELLETWNLKHVKQCLFSHSPNEWGCCHKKQPDCTSNLSYF